MRKLLILTIIFLSIPLLFAQENVYVGKEVPNLVSAVKAANPGDYILFPSGKRYVLTREEIDILNGSFDYYDLYRR